MGIIKRTEDELLLRFEMAPHWLTLALCSTPVVLIFPSAAIAVPVARLFEPMSDLLSGIVFYMILCGLPAVIFVVLLKTLDHSIEYTLNAPAQVLTVTTRVLQRPWTERYDLQNVVDVTLRPPRNRRYVAGYSLDIELGSGKSLRLRALREKTALEAGQALSEFLRLPLHLRTGEIVTIVQPFDTD